MADIHSNVIVLIDYGTHSSKWLNGLQCLPILQLMLMFCSFRRYVTFSRDNQLSPSKF